MEVRGALLATAVVLGISLSGERIALRGLLDQGWETSFITEDAAQRLNIKRSYISTTISGLGTSKLQTSKSEVHLDIQSRMKVQIEVDASLLRKLTALLPSKVIQSEKWDHLKKLTLADPRYSKPGHIDLLLGADIYAEILEEGVQKGLKGFPIAQRISFGWVVFGQYQSQKKGKGNKITTLHINVELSEQIQRFWKIEEIDPSRKLTTEEKLCESIYKETIERAPDGRYTAKLSFKLFGEKPRLGILPPLSCCKRRDVLKQISICVSNIPTASNLRTHGSYQDKGRQSLETGQ